LLYDTVSPKAMEGRTHTRITDNSAARHAPMPKKRGNSLWQQPPTPTLDGLFSELTVAPVKDD